MSNLITSDEDVRTLCKEGVVTELIHRYVLSQKLLQGFYDQAEELMKDIPTDVLRVMTGTTIRSFGYGQKHTTVLKEIELYHNYSSNQKENHPYFNKSKR